MSPNPPRKVSWQGHGLMKSRRAIGNPDERRSRIRFHLDLAAEISVPSGWEIRGHLRDISINTMFIQTNAIIPKGSPCIALIAFNGKSSKVCLSITGQVSRCDTEGIAIRFDEELEVLALLPFLSYRI